MSLLGKARAAVQLGFIELPQASVSVRDRWDVGADPLAERRGELVGIEHDGPSAPTAKLKLRGTLRQQLSEAATIESQITTKASFAIEQGWPIRVEQEIEGPVPGQGTFSIEVDARWVVVAPAARVDIQTGLRPDD